MDVRAGLQDRRAHGATCAETAVGDVAASTRIMPVARVFNTVFLCRNPQLLAEFWAGALEYDVVQHDDDLVRIAPPVGSAGPNLLFLSSPDVPKRSALHLDLAADDAAAEVSRLTNLGAHPVDAPNEDGSPRWRQANGITWMVLADPEGNQFCVGSEPGG